MIDEELREALPNPKSTVEALDAIIIGQEAAKKTLSLMLLNRAILRLCRAGRVWMEHPIQKANVLLIGPTGTGKTALMRALSDVSDVPISINDITSVTSAGYIGGKVEDILVRHVKECENWVYRNWSKYISGDHPSYQQRRLLEETVRCGIVYIDEIDKICTKSSFSSRDVSGGMVQNELLKFLEMGDVSLGPSKLPYPESGITHVKTDDLFFVCGGAFSGLSDIIFARLNKNGGIGFHTDISIKSTNNKNPESLLRFVTTQDLIDYGLKPEFLGRVPLRATLNAFTVDSLQKVITEPENSILKQYIDMFYLFGIELKIEKAALKLIAQRALDLKIGARALKPVFEDLFADFVYSIFDLKDGKLIITKSIVNKKLGE